MAIPNYLYIHVMEFVVLFGALALFIGVIVWAIRYARKQSKKKNDMYRALGLKLDMNYSETKHMLVKVPHLSGTRNDRLFEIYEYIVGSGKNQTVYTAIRYHKSPHNFQFRIGKENFFTKVGKKMGFKDIEFDNMELDKTFLFKSKDEDQFRSIMDYKLLHDLEGIEKSIRGTIENKDGLLTYTVVGATNKQERFDDLENVMSFMDKLVLKEVRR